MFPNGNILHLHIPRYRHELAAKTKTSSLFAGGGKTEDVFPFPKPKPRPAGRRPWSERQNPAGRGDGA